MRSFAPTNREKKIELRAPSTEEGARALITWLLWIYSGKISGIKLVEIVAEQFPTLPLEEVYITQLEHDPLGILNPNNVWHV